MTAATSTARDRWIARLFWPAMLVLYLTVQFFVNRGTLEGPAPKFEGLTADGRSYAGPITGDRPTLVYFWASWCRICSAMQGSINSLAEDTSLVSVAFLSGAADEVRDYMDKQAFRPLAVVDENGDIGRRYGVRGVPATFILGPEGEVRFSTVGYTSELGIRIRLWLAGL